MEPTPASVQRMPPEANEDFVRAIMAANRQELKDILYESCEQAVQKVAHRTLTLYLQSGGRMSPMAGSSNGHAPSILVPSKQLQPSSSPKSQLQPALGPNFLKIAPRSFGTFGSIGSSLGLDGQVIGSTSSNCLMPLAIQPGKASWDLADPSKKSQSPDTEPLIRDGCEASQKITGTGSTKSKTKAHTKRSMIMTSPRASQNKGAKKGLAGKETELTLALRQTMIGRNTIRRQSSTKKLRGAVQGMRAAPAPEQGIFANAEDMKEKLRAALTETPYDVTNFYSTEGFCQAIARSTTMENVTLAVIAFNAFWISIDVDLNNASIITEADPVFQVIDNFFCFFFLAEVLIRLGAFEAKKNCLKDAWFVFDSFLAISMVFETWFLPIAVALLSDKESGGYKQDTSLLKGLRLARLMRMARVIRLLRALPELMVVIKGLFVAARAVSCTLLLMLMIIYVFAITFRQLTDGTDIGKNVFPSVPVTMRYLMVQGTMPDLYDPVHEIWDEGVFFALAFLVFIFVTSITVMNMLVGIMVGVIDTVATVEKEQLTVNFVKDNLMMLLEEMQAEDTDRDGLVSKNEFEKLIQTPDAIRSFTAMGVDVINLVDLGNFLFCEEDVGIPFADFMEMILQLRGSNQATVKDVVDLRRFVTMEMRALFRMLMETLMSDNKSNAFDLASLDGLSSRSISASMGIRLQKTFSNEGTVDGSIKFDSSVRFDRSKEDPGRNYSPDSSHSRPGPSPLETVHEPRDEDAQPSEFFTSVDAEEQQSAPDEIPTKESGELDTSKKRKFKNQIGKAHKSQVGNSEATPFKD